MHVGRSVSASGVNDRLVELSSRQCWSFRRFMETVGDVFMRIVDQTDYLFPTAIEISEFIIAEIPKVRPTGGSWEYSKGARCRHWL